MAKRELNQQINKGKVEKAYALILDFSVEEIGLLQNKLRARKNQLIGRDENRNRDTVEL